MHFLCIVHWPKVKVHWKQSKKCALKEGDPVVRKLRYYSFKIVTGALKAIQKMCLLQMHWKRSKKMCIEERWSSGKETLVSQFPWSCCGHKLCLQRWLLLSLISLTSGFFKTCCALTKICISLISLKVVDMVSWLLLLGWTKTYIRRWSKNVHWRWSSSTEKWFNSRATGKILLDM